MRFEPGHADPASDSAVMELKGRGDGESGDGESREALALDAYFAST